MILLLDEHIMTFILLVLLSILPYCLSETWTVYVYTGTERFSGTDSNVYIRLFHGENEHTSEIQLTHYNWLPDTKDFPIRNLFETGARERFLIQTENIGSVTKIEIRHNNFPIWQADWLLDQVIVERNRDGAKFKFYCNCWLRGSKPYITISALPDQRANDKNKNKDSSSRNNRAFVIILFVLISLIVSIFCCFNGYRRRQRHRAVVMTNTIEQIQQEPSLLDTDPLPSSGPQLWIDTKRRWKNFRHGLPSYNHARTIQSTTAVPTDEPPAYEDLYPNRTVPRNTALSSNL